MRGSYRLGAAMVAAVGLVAGMTFPLATPAGAASGSTSATPVGFVAGQSVEVASARSEFAKTYSNPDGTRTLMSALVPLNYVGVGGSWQPVDSSVVSDSSVPGGLRSAANAWTAHFEPLPTGLVVDTAGGARLSFSPAGTAAVVPQASVDGVVYANAWPGVDLDYQVSPLGVKESIVLHRQPVSSVFQFDTGPVAYSPTADGRLASTNSAAAGITLLAPVVLDSQLHQVPAAAPVLVASGSSGSNVVEVTVDPAWLASLSASDFPVTIDPSLGVGSGNTECMTSTGYTHQPCEVSVGNSGGSGNPNEYWRTMGYFNYSSIDGTYVTAASLELKNLDAGCGCDSINVHTPGNVAYTYANAGSGTVVASPYTSTDMVITSAALTNAYRTWVDSSTNNEPLSFTGLEYSGQYSFSEFQYFVLTLTYDHYPNTPTGPATTPATTCTTGSGRPYLNTTTPTLKATVSTRMAAA